MCNNTANNNIMNNFVNKFNNIRWNGKVTQKDFLPYKDEIGLNIIFRNKIKSIIKHFLIEIKHFKNTWFC